MPRPLPPHSLHRAWPRAVLAAAALVVAGGASAQPPLVVQDFQCRGEEPFWGLAGTRLSAVLSTPTAKGKRETVFRGALQNVAAGPGAIVWRGESTHLPKDTLVVVLREEACRSTMKDGPAQSHRAVLSLRGSEALVGCCSVTMGSPPAAKGAP